MCKPSGLGGGRSGAYVTALRDALSTQATLATNGPDDVEALNALARLVDGRFTGKSGRRAMIRTLITGTRWRSIYGRGQARKVGLPSFMRYSGSHGESNGEPAALPRCLNRWTGGEAADQMETSDGTPG
jgi:hypothetical protein